MSDVANADLDLGDDALEEAPKKRSWKKLALFVLLPLLLVGGGVGGGVYMGFVPTFGLFEPGEAAPETQQQKPAFFHELPEMTVNLASSGARPQYLKMRVALEVSSRDVISAITPVQPRIHDAFQVYLRELRPTDLEGSRSVYRLKEELLRRVNLAIHPYEVDRILFNEIIVQ